MRNVYERKKDKNAIKLIQSKAIISRILEEIDLSFVIAL
jgi:hypothetical protein